MKLHIKNSITQGNMEMPKPYQGVAAQDTTLASEARPRERGFREERNPLQGPAAALDNLLSLPWWQPRWKRWRRRGRPPLLEMLIGVMILRVELIGYWVVAAVEMADKTTERTTSEG
jgi:hypothetical protein